MTKIMSYTEHDRRGTLNNNRYNKSFGKMDFIAGDNTNDYVQNNCGCEVSSNNRKTSYRYRVQLGLFRNYNNALNLQMRLIHDGLRADIYRQGDLYAVHIGDFVNLDEAALLELYLKLSGFDTLLVAI